MSSCLDDPQIQACPTPEHIQILKHPIGIWIDFEFVDGDKCGGELWWWWSVRWPSWDVEDDGGDNMYDDEDADKVDDDEDRQCQFHSSFLQQDWMSIHLVIGDNHYNFADQIIWDIGDKHRDIIYTNALSLQWQNIRLANIILLLAIIYFISYFNSMSFNYSNLGCRSTWLMYIGFLLSGTKDTLLKIFRKIHPSHTTDLT